MVEKKYICTVDGICDNDFNDLSFREIADLLNNLSDENKRLKECYKRKDRQLQRAKKDTRKYTDYFMVELGWDCDRIIEEVFR